METHRKNAPIAKSVSTCLMDFRKLYFFAMRNTMFTINHLYCYECYVHNRNPVLVILGIHLHSNNSCVSASNIITICCFQMSFHKSVKVKNANTHPQFSNCMSL